jgi:hypothetical protein
MSVPAARALLDTIIKDVEPLFREGSHSTFDWTVWELPLSRLKDALQACSRTICQDALLGLPASHLSLLAGNLRSVKVDVFETLREARNPPPARWSQHHTRFMVLRLGKANVHLSQAVIIMEHHLSKCKSGGFEAHVRILL